MFVIKQPGKHLVCIGSSVILMTKGFEDYNCLVSLLKTHYANFKALPAFGTDGEFNWLMSSYSDFQMRSTYCVRYTCQRT